MFHRDGYLIVNINVNVVRLELKNPYLYLDGEVKSCQSPLILKLSFQEGKIPNPFFTEFGKVLSCLSKPGCTRGTYTPSFYVWYDQWFKTSRFYAYPGSIGQYDCATIIQAPKSLGPYISIPQVT